MTSPSASRAAARGTAFGFFLRTFSFTLSQITFRFIDPIALGRASIRLELLLNTALFLGREGFRLALMRRNEKDEEETRQKITNVSWLSIPFGFMLSAIAATAHIFTCYRMELEDAQTLLDYQLSGILYCVAAVMESLSEPIAISCIRDLDVDTRAAAEGAASLAKAVVSMVLLSGFSRFLSMESFSERWPVSAFGLSQLAYALVLTYVLYRRKGSTISWPRCPKIGCAFLQYFDVVSLKLVFVFTMQGILKHCLTEGDRIVLTALADGYSQGIYAMASSYGGIASRILLQPIEENARILFARYRADTRDDRFMLRQLFCVLVKLVLYIGLLFACIASNYTRVLLRILAGERWGSSSEASAALSAFCIYTALLAINGLTEAFVYGVAGSSGDVGKLGLAHIVVGAVFTVSATLLVNSYGTVGLIMANGFAMSLRSTYSLYFASRFFKAKMTTFAMFCSLAKDFLPHPFVLGAFILSFYVTYLSNDRFVSDEIHMLSNDITISIFSKEWLTIASRHVGVGISCVVVIASIAIQCEKNFRRTIMTVFRDKTD